MSAPSQPRLSVVVPAFGEADRIAETISTIRRALGDLEGGLEIVVVDDGSSDGTADAAREGGADVVVQMAHNRGKGAAVRTGVAAASGRAIGFTDADLAYEPGQFRRLLAEVEAGADMVVGSRTHEHTTTLVQARRLRELGGRGVNGLARLLLLGEQRDTQCGLKCFRAEVARSLFERGRIDGFSFDIELFVIAKGDGLDVVDVPVTVTNTSRSTVRVLREGARLVRDLFKIRAWARRGAYRP